MLESLTLVERWTKQVFKSGGQSLNCFLKSILGVVLGQPQILRVFKSPTSIERWHELMFISGGNSYTTSSFCVVVLDPTN